MRRISFNNSAGQKIWFNENGELETGFDIINWITFSDLSFKKVRVGSIDSQEKVVTTDEDSIIWPSRFNQVWSCHILACVKKPSFTPKTLLEPKYSTEMIFRNRTQHIQYFLFEVSPGFKVMTRLVITGDILDAPLV